MGSISTTNNVTIATFSNYLEDYSLPAQQQYFYSYRIRISNHNEVPIQLVSRYFLVIDSDSQRKVIRGKGVVGEQPIIQPKKYFQYCSFAPMATSFGTMEGIFHFITGEGNKIDAEISRFYFATNLSEYPTNLFKRGEIVRHGEDGYRGVIVDFDMSFASNKCITKKKISQNNKNSPWYHVLVDGTDKVSYVMEKDLVLCEDRTPLKHPLLSHFFSGYQRPQYIRNQNSWCDINV